MLAVSQYSKYAEANTVHTERLAAPRITKMETF